MKKLIAAIVAVFMGTTTFAVETKRVDINTASEEQLKALPGVSGDDAKKIIEARPFAEKEELKTRKVLSADEYEKIKRLIESVC